MGISQLKFLQPLATVIWLKIPYHIFHVRRHVRQKPRIIYTCTRTHSTRGASQLMCHWACTRPDLLHTLLHQHTLHYYILVVHTQVQRG